METKLFAVRFVFTDEKGNELLRTETTKIFTHEHAFGWITEGCNFKQTEDKNRFEQTAIDGETKITAYII